MPGATFGDLDAGARALLALVAGTALGVGLNALAARRHAPRDLILVLFALLVALLGVYAALGLASLVIAAFVLVGAFGVGALMYGLITLAGRWAERG